MNRISTERLNYLPKATQLDMAGNNSKGSQTALVKYKSAIFILELYIKILNNQNGRNNATILVHFHMGHIL